MLQQRHLSPYTRGALLTEMKEDISLLATLKFECKEILCYDTAYETKKKGNKEKT